jgi:type IV pilus assembly protein PilM
VGLFDKFLKKQKGLVGLDIGSSSVKLIELKPVGKSGTEFRLVKAGFEVLPPEAIVDGAIMDSGAIVDAINRLFTNLKVKTSDIATSVSGNAVIVKKISLPQMTAEELGESIHWEAEQYIPFDIQDVSLDYEILEGAGDGTNMDVLLVAVKKDKISDYTSVITQSGRTPRIVDVDVFALQNCHEINYGADSSRVIALLNLGAAITNVNIIRGSNSLFNRDIAVGGNLATDALQKDLGLPHEVAEAVKRARMRKAYPRTTSTRSFRAEPRRSSRRSRRHSTSSAPPPRKSASIRSISPADRRACRGCVSCSWSASTRRWSFSIPSTQ